MYSIQTPSSFDRGYMRPFLEDLDSHIFETEVTIDFSPLSYAYPLPTLIAGSAIKRFVQKRSGLNLKTFRSKINDAKSAHSYLKHIGFFNFIGISEGNQIGEASGSRFYVPIREIRHAEIVKTAQARQISNAEAIVENVDDLAAMLAGNKSGSDAQRTICYVLRELIRNAFEHSGATSCFISGQRWMDGEVQIAIIDEGRGILESLSEKFDLQNHSDALTLATKPGITRIQDTESKNNEFGNSGYGLYVLSELGGSFGWFAMGSGDSCLVSEKRNAHCDPFPFNGTFVGLHMKTAPSDFSLLLEDIIQIGETEALKNGGVSRASESSRSATL